MTIIKKILPYFIYISFLAFSGGTKNTKNNSCERLPGFTSTGKKLDINNLKLVNNKSTENPELLTQHLKPVSMINLWASWCGPCRKELPILDNVKNTESYNVVTVNLADKAEDINSLFGKLEIKNLPKLRLPDYKVLENLNLSGLPATVIKTNKNDYVSVGILKSNADEISSWLDCLSQRK